MYAIDIRYQSWLRECKRASDRCEVDDRIINLSEIINDISNSRFFVELPPSFTNSNDNSDDRNSGRKNSQGGGRKRSGKNDDKENGKKRHVQNENQIEEFKMESLGRMMFGESVSTPAQNGKETRG